MLTKENVKQKIDELPVDLIEKVYTYINSLTTENRKKEKIRTFKLKGQFDNVNIRHKAYE